GLAVGKLPDMVTPVRRASPLAGSTARALPQSALRPAGGGEGTRGVPAGFRRGKKESPLPRLLGWSGGGGGEVVGEGVPVGRAAPVAGSTARAVPTSGLLPPR